MHPSPAQSALVLRRPIITLLALVAVLMPLLAPTKSLVPVHLPDAPLETVTTAASLAQFPIAFVPNRGQSDPRVRFQTRALGGTVFLTPSGLVLKLPAVVHLRFVGANATSTIEGTRQLSGVVNYIVGNDPAHWRSQVPTYAGVVYHQLYPGIDLRYDGATGQLKGTYIVAPGADPGTIRWRYDGAAIPHVDAVGDLILAIPAPDGASQTTLTEHAPEAWQMVDGQRRPVTAHYVVERDGAVHFDLGVYDPRLPLTIDPIVSYSTYLGGSGDEEGNAIAVDTQGNAYIAGKTTSATFPAPGKTFHISAPLLPGDSDAFVAKLDPDGQLIYLTYLGGIAPDYANAIAVDQAGAAYIGGFTDSGNFPLAPAPALQPCRSDPDGIVREGFVAKLSASGDRLVYSTCLGGTGEDNVKGLALDNAGNVYVTGFTSATTDFPTTAGALQPIYSERGCQTVPRYCPAAFVASLRADGQALRYSTYLGGGHDGGVAIAVDASGSAYVAGNTQSTGYLTTTGAFQQAWSSGICPQGPCDDAFITRLSPDGSTALYSTYFGGASQDEVYGIAIDGSGSAYITGRTFYSSNFPVLNPIQPNNATGAETDAFVAKLRPDGGGLVYATTFGGPSGARGLGIDSGYSIAVDSEGNAYITGSTTTVDPATFPMVNPIQPALAGGVCHADSPPPLGSYDYPCPDAFVAKLNAQGNKMVFATYLGGGSSPTINGNSDMGRAIALDVDGNIYIAGSTNAEGLPTVQPLQPSRSGPVDAFVAKITTAPQFDLTAEASAPSLAYCAAAPCPTVAYTIAVRARDGAATAALTATLPLGLTFLEGSASGGAVYNAAAHRLNFRGPVTPGAPITLSYQARLDPGVPPGTLLATSLSLTGAGVAIQRNIPVAVQQSDFSGTLVLIYASSDNNLSGDILRLVDAAERGVANPGVVALLLLDGPGDDDTYLVRLQAPAMGATCPNRYADPTCGGRYRLGQSLWRWPTDNLGDRHTLAAFVRAAALAYPGASRRVLSLVGHGGGWSPPLLGGQPSGHGGQPTDDPLGGMLWDNHPGTSLSTPALGKALHEAMVGLDQDDPTHAPHRLDLLFLDACDMAMAEVAYEVRDSAHTLLASSNWKWAGFPYDRHLASLGGDGPTIGRAWLRNEAAFMRQFPDEPFTYALLDLDTLPAVRDAANALGAALVRPGGPLDSAAGRDLVDKASRAADRYDSNQDGAITLEDNYVDLLSFAQALADTLQEVDPMVAAAARTLGQAVSAASVAEIQSGRPWRFPGRQWAWQRGAGGLSIYLPLHSDDWRRRYYGLLEFTNGSPWQQFINAWWQNAPAPANPACSSGCNLPPGFLASVTRLYLPIVQR